MKMVFWYNSCNSVMLFYGILQNMRYNVKNLMNTKKGFINRF